MKIFIRYKSRVKLLFIILLLIPKIVVAEPDKPIKHWIGLIPNDFLTLFAAEEKGKNTLWVIPLHEQPDSDSVSVGKIEVRYTINVGLTATLFSGGFSEKKIIEPHLYEQDFSYSPWYHLTVLGREGGWVKIKADENAESAWGNFAAAFGSKNLFFLHLSRGSILTWINDSGENESIFVEHVNPESLIVREEQDVDMYCGNDALTHEPYTTKMIPMSSWINLERGISRFNISYSRGC